MAKTITITSKEFLMAGAKATQIFEFLEGKKLKAKGISEKDITEISAGISSLMLQALFPDMDSDDVDDVTSEIVSEKIGDISRRSYEN